MFLEQKLDAAAGVREPLDDYAKDHLDMRVMNGAFEQIAQAMGTVKGRAAGAAFVSAFIEEMKASGFVARGAQSLRAESAGGAGGEVARAA